MIHCNMKVVHQGPMVKYFYCLLYLLKYFQVSDGGVHSHIKHLESLIDAAKELGVPKCFIQFFSDGRDTSPTSGGR